MENEHEKIYSKWQELLERHLKGLRAIGEQLYALKFWFPHHSKIQQITPHYEEALLVRDMIWTEISKNDAGRRAKIAHLQKNATERLAALKQSAKEALLKIQDHKTVQRIQKELLLFEQDIEPTFINALKLLFGRC